MRVLFAFLLCLCAFRAQADESTAREKLQAWSAGDVACELTMSKSDPTGQRKLFLTADDGDVVSTGVYYAQLPPYWLGSINRGTKETTGKNILSLCGKAS